MQSKVALLSQQIEWATTTGRKPDQKGYLSDLEHNLLKPLSHRTRASFETGSGSELVPAQSRPAKMAALHSSSALAVNVFDYWSEGPLDAVTLALDLDHVPSRLEFEAQFPTGLEGTPPNLDVALRYADQSVVAIESKFSEWLTPKSPRKENFKPKYFPEAQSLWAQVGLDNAQKLANAMHHGSEHFCHLDAAQLLKHMLGLATKHRGTSSLYYLFYEWPGRESPVHRAELERFSSLIGADMPFRWASYQDVFNRLKSALGMKDAAYVEYLGLRYFRGEV